MAIAKIFAAAGDNVYEISCSPVDLGNQGLLVHAACDLSNYKNFKGFPGLSKLADADITGIRLEQFAEVTLPSISGRLHCRIRPAPPAQPSSPSHNLPQVYEWYESGSTTVKTPVNFP